MDYTKPLLIMTNRIILYKIANALDTEAKKFTKAGLDENANEVLGLKNQINSLICSDKEVGSIVSYE